MSSVEPVGNIDVENSYGQIKVILPQSSRFNLDAESANGQVLQTGFDQLQRTAREILAAVLGVGGPTIKLRTSYRNIIIQASASRQPQANALAK